MLSSTSEVFGNSEDPKVAGNECSMIQFPDEGWGGMKNKPCSEHVQMRKILTRYRHGSRIMRSGTICAGTPVYMERE